MAKKAPPEVEVYLAKLPDVQRRTMLQLRKAVLQAIPSLTQSISPWGYLSFSTSGEGMAFTLIPHRQHANLQISNGAKIASKLPQVEGTGKGLRHIKFPYGQPVDVTLVGKAVRLSSAAREHRNRA